MKRTITIIASCIVLLVVSVVIIRAVNGNKPKADITMMNNMCNSAIAGDCAIDLIVVNVDKPGGSSGRDGYITAYNKDGKTVVSSAVKLASDTFQQIGEPSQFAAGNDIQMTPLGVYSTGSVWASSVNDPDGYVQHPNISDNSVFGSLFIELSGIPVDGGSPLCGLNDPSSATCRHIGIHSGANLNTPTHGCIKTENDVVRKIAKNLNGAKVVVTDIELAGDAAPVDFESYDPNFSSPFKIIKNDWNPSFSVSALDGQPLGKVHDFGRWWIAEVAKPSGRYEIKSSAAGYQTGETVANFVRETAAGGTLGAFKEKLGGTSLVLGLPLMDGNYSRYFGSFYHNGYIEELRFSAWDISYTNQYLPDVSTAKIILPIANSYPKCPAKTSSNQYMMGDPNCNKSLVSSFAIYAITTPWHDLGYGSRNGLEGGSGREIASFSYDYTNPQSSITVTADLSKLTESEKKAMYTWGIAISQKQKVNHSVNDYLVMIDTHRNDIHVNQVDPFIQPELDGEEGNSPNTQIAAPVTTPSAPAPIPIEAAPNNVSTPGLFFGPAVTSPSAWDPINIFNTAPIPVPVSNTSAWNINYNGESFTITAAQPVKYQSLVDYLNPVKWFAPEPQPVGLFQPPL
ncbi:MAG: hypothetical protein BWY19_00056 [bacterium ADurb.Bin212]|nr:MAG: hypothetical protein BWY19_00056 [bacterium ADurb.Bin212]